MLLHAVQVSEDTFARDESVLVDTVSGLSMGDARRALDYWRQAADQAAFARDAHHTHQSRGLSISETLGGMVRIDADLDPESGATVTIALRSLVEPTLLDPTDTRTLRQRRADALTEICSDHLTHGDAPVSGGFRPHVTLTISPHPLHVYLILGIKDGQHPADALPFFSQVALVQAARTLRNMGVSVSLAGLPWTPAGS